MAAPDFLAIQAGAHEAATSPNNNLPLPTEAQITAGNYKKGRIKLHGFDIAIEHPRHTYRSGKDANGQAWSTRLAAHYGYFVGSMGADGDPVDCFVGEYPYADTIYIINQVINGKFDEHKVMVGFMDEQAAKTAYQLSYTKGWQGLHSIVPCSITQFKWWLKHSNKKQPAYASQLPHEGTAMKVVWNDLGQPVNYDTAAILYQLRKETIPEQGDLLMDSATMRDLLEDSESVVVLDALVRQHSTLPRTMEALRLALNRAGTTLSIPESAQISDPVSRKGAANVFVLFTLSDGQSVTIVFANPDLTPKQVKPSDQLVSQRWLLNKKDITLLVAPESGKDLSVVDVAKRVMKLAEKNSAAFQRANTKKDEKLANIESLKVEITQLEQDLKSAEARLAQKKAEIKAVKTADMLDPLALSETITEPTMIDKILEGYGYQSLDDMPQGLKATANKLITAINAMDAAELKRILYKDLMLRSPTSPRLYFRYEPNTS